MIPAYLISHQLGKLETAPACSLGLLLTLVVLIYVQVQLFESPTGWAWPKGEELHKLLIVSGLLVVVSLALAWILRIYRRTCDGQPGWVIALLNYYFFAGLLVVGTGAICGSCVVISNMTATLANGSLRDIARTVTQICLLLAVPFWIWWTNRRAKRTMIGLQRKLAVAMAARVLEERTARLDALTSNRRPDPGTR